MMKVRILVEFHDADDFSKVYAVGEEAEFGGERLAELLRLGYVSQEKPKRVRKTKDE